MIVYFSGTGNSRFAAQHLRKALGEEIVDAGVKIKENDHTALQSERPWIFVAPTYAWRMPRVFEAYLRSVELIGNKNAYFVLTCGGHICDAGKYAAEFCRAKGLGYRGIKQVIMPENYIAMYDAPEESEARKIVVAALPVLEDAAEHIRRGRDFPPHDGGFGASLKSGAVNDAFYKLFVKADAFFATEKCISCGACAAACPLNNIVLTEGKPKWGSDCTHCMACICGCPEEAIEYGKKSAGKPRYRCPKV